MSNNLTMTNTKSFLKQYYSIQTINKAEKLASLYPVPNRDFEQNAVRPFKNFPAPIRDVLWWARMVHHMDNKKSNNRNRVVR